MSQVLNNIVLKTYSHNAQKLMNKFLLLGLTLTSALTSFAQFNGDGFYRLENYMTERYAYVRNNYGKINISTTSADLTSIQLWKNFDKAACDPATVIYIQKLVDSNNNISYNIIAQGTSLREIIGHYVKIKDNGNGTYKAYAEQSGTIVYLGDNELSESQDGALATNAKNRYRDWYIKPVTLEEGNYFGFAPSIKVGNKYYLATYTSFSFTLASKNTKVYYISKTDEGRAGIKEITDEVIPGGTPILIESTSPNAADNKVNVVTTVGNKITDNKLVGVYFDYYSMNSAKLNQVNYDAATMRVLGTTSTGELGFITATDLETIPANTCYLSVPASAKSELTIVDESEIAGVSNVLVDKDDAPFDIYTLSGTLVRHNATSTDNLPAGIYVAKGRKIVVLP